MDARWKLLVGLVIIAAAAALTLRTSQAADPFLDVHQVLADPDGHGGTALAVRGTVAPNASVEARGVTFRLADLDPARPGDLWVVYEGTLPDAFGAKPAVVTGTLEQTPEGVRLRAENIQVGCSSKY